MLELNRPSPKRPRKEDAQIDSQIANSNQPPEPKLLDVAAGMVGLRNWMMSMRRKVSKHDGWVGFHRTMTIVNITFWIRDVVHWEENLSIEYPTCTWNCSHRRPVTTLPTFFSPFQKTYLKAAIQELSQTALGSYSVYDVLSWIKTLTDKCGYNVKFSDAFWSRKKILKRILDSRMPKINPSRLEELLFNKSTLTAVIALVPVASIGSNRRT